MDLARGSAKATVTPWRWNGRFEWATSFVATWLDVRRGISTVLFCFYLHKSVARCARCTRSCGTLTILRTSRQGRSTKHVLWTPGGTSSNPLWPDWARRGRDFPRSRRYRRPTRDSRRLAGKGDRWSVDGYRASPVCDIRRIDGLLLPCGFRCRPLLPTYLGVSFGGRKGRAIGRVLRDRAAIDQHHSRRGRRCANGRVYLPEEDLERFGVREEQLALRERSSPEIRELLAFESQRAYENYDRARLLVPLVDPVGRPVLKTIVGIYYGLLTRSCDENTTSLADESPYLFRESLWSHCGRWWVEWKRTGNSWGNAFHHAEGSGRNGIEIKTPRSNSSSHSGRDLASCDPRYSKPRRIPKSPWINGRGLDCVVASE